MSFLRPIVFIIIVLNNIVNTLIIYLFMMYADQLHELEMHKNDIFLYKMEYECRSFILIYLI